MNMVASLGEVAGEVHHQPPKPPWSMVKIGRVARRTHVDFCTRIVCTGNFVTSQNCRLCYHISLSVQQMKYTEINSCDFVQPVHSAHSTGNAY